MSENAMQHCPADADEVFDIFVRGALLELESVETAIDALARDEAIQAAEASASPGG